jgi:hypothetical protein
LDKTSVFHLGDPGSIPGHSTPFVPILLVCPFLPFKLSRHFKIAADSRVGNQSFGKIDKKMSTNKDIIVANLIHIYNLALNSNITIENKCNQLQTLFIKEKKISHQLKKLNYLPMSVALLIS